MKRTNRLFPMLLCVCLSLAGCTGSEEKQLEKMAHISRSIAFLLLDGGKDIGGKSDSTIFGHH